MLLDAKGRPVHGGKPVFDEVASAAKDDIAAPFIGELRAVQDDILRGLSGGIKEYKRLLDDWQVYSTYQQRRRAITSREWEIVPGGPGKASEMAADWLKEVVVHVGWDRVYDKMHYGVFYGHAVGELMYARDGQRIMVDQIKVRDRARFRYDRDFQLRLITAENPQGERMPPRKFWVFSAGADTDDDPYGMGLAHYLYWPVFFKRHGVKFYLVFMEKWAAPTPIGKYQPGTPLSEQKKLLAALAAMTTDAGIIIPEGMDVDKFEALRTGTGSYEPFLSYMDGAVSKVVLSQTMTTDDGSSRSQAEVHQDVAEAVVKGDADLIAGSFNAGTSHFEGPIQWLTEWNFPGAEPPQFYYVFEEEEDMNQVAERDEKIFGFGYEPTEERIRTVYGEGYRRKSEPEGDEEPPPPAAEEPAFAEDLDETVDAFAGRAGAVGLDGVIEPIRRMLASSRSLEEFRDRLVTEYTELDADALGTVLMRAMTAADLAGRYEVQEGE